MKGKNINGIEKLKEKQAQIEREIEEIMSRLDGASPRECGKLVSKLVKLKFKEISK